MVCWFSEDYKSVIYTAGKKCSLCLSKEIKMRQWAKFERLTNELNKTKWDEIIAKIIQHFKKDKTENFPFKLYISTSWA